MAASISSASLRFHYGAPEKDVFLLGNARSGTTWVMNLLACMPGYRSAFEPLAHRGARRNQNPPGNSHRQPRRNLSELKVYLQQVLSQPYCDDSPLHRLSAIKRPFATQTIVKMVDANELLGWLAQNFPARLLLLRRSPLAVLRSRLRLGWPLPAQLKSLLENRELLEPFQQILETLLASGSEKEQFYARIWLDNWLGSRLAQQHQAVICDYEELAANPLVRASQLFRQLGFELPPALSEMLQRPSDTSWPRARKAVLAKKEEQSLAELEIRLRGLAEP